MQLFCVIRRLSKFYGFSDLLQSPIPKGRAQWCKGLNAWYIRQDRVTYAAMKNNPQGRCFACKRPILAHFWFVWKPFHTVIRAGLMEQLLSGALLVSMAEGTRLYDRSSRTGSSNCHFHSQVTGQSNSYSSSYFRLRTRSTGNIWWTPLMTLTCDIHRSGDDWNPSVCFNVISSALLMF